MSEPYQTSQHATRERRGAQGTRRFVPQDPTVAPAHMLDPVIRRGKHRFTGPGPVALTVIAVLMMGYAFNLGGEQAFIDDLFSGAYMRSQAHTEQVATAYNAALPFVLLGIVGIGIWVVLSSRKQAAEAHEKVRPLTWREAVTLHGFVSSAVKHGATPDVAREAFRLLLPFCRYGLRTRMSDTLRGDLRMTATEVLDLFADVLHKTERKRDPKLGEPKIETVLDLLMTATACPKRYVADDGGSLERRGEENWVVRPAQR